MKKGLRDWKWKQFNASLNWNYTEHKYKRSICFDLNLEHAWLKGFIHTETNMHMYVTCWKGVFVMLYVLES